MSVIALLLALVEPGCAPSEAQGSAVSSAEAHQLVAAGAALVDVRTPEEFVEGHVDGARNIPLAEISRRMADLPRDRVVVVYCHSGARSAQAAATLRGAGYRVRNLGPMSAW